ncbi:MAG: glycosyltransferase family 4 protein [Phycisphaerae bacterium]|nr:glycosyltransferase family 4 protein [Phycisphaerae bacterium]
MSKKHNNKSVCHITTIHSLNDTRVFYRQCRSLVDAGYDVHLVIPCDADAVKDGVHIHRCPRFRNRLLHMLTAPWLAMRLALKTHAGIYHYHDPELIFMGFVLKWIFQKKVVFDIHESIPRQLLSKQWLPKWLRKPIAFLYKITEWIFIRGQVIVLASEHSVPDYNESAYLVKNYPHYDKEFLDSIEAENNTSTSQNVPILIYVGSVAIERGADIYIELAGRLHAQGVEFHMQLVGRDSYNCAEKLKQRAQQLNISNKVSFIGQVDHKEAMRLVSKASIGLCLLRPYPNYLKSLATKILEYMMGQTAVLSSDFDCWRRYVEGEKSGMMVDPENLDQVTDTCLKMLSDPQQLEQMGKRGREAVREKYNWNTEFNELLKCYDDLLR